MVSNRVNFSVDPPTFHIPKYSSYTVTVTYSPSSIGEEESGRIKFVSPQLGEWVYLVSGSGQKPSVHPEDIIGECAVFVYLYVCGLSVCGVGTELLVTPVNVRFHPCYVALCCAVSATAGGSTSESISFRNPFNETMEVVLELRSSDAGVARKSSFVLLKKQKSSIPALAVVQLPFSFSPTEISEIRATLLVSCPDRDLLWTYNIRGISECPPPDSVLEYVCKTRTTKTFPISLILPGLRLNGGEESFTHELVVRPSGRDCVLWWLLLLVVLPECGRGSVRQREDCSPQLFAWLFRWEGCRGLCFTGGTLVGCRPRVQVPDAKKADVSRAVKLSMVTPGGVLTSATAPLELELQLQPLKPFETSVQLIINKASGGRYVAATTIGERGCAVPGKEAGVARSGGFLLTWRVFAGVVRWCNVARRRWRYIARIAAQEPDPDDTILIEASLHRTSNVAFTLANPLVQYASFKVRSCLPTSCPLRVVRLLPFGVLCRPDALACVNCVVVRWFFACVCDLQAQFSLDSGAEFAVFPTEGVLPPQGSPPLQFVVSFTPHEYGKTSVAKLFIEVRVCIFSSTSGSGEATPRVS